MKTEFALFPTIEPYDSGYLSTSSAHEVYFEQCGNPDGTPVIFLHGGPGSGCSPTQRRFFDPNFYRIILMDQRGCGRSRPQGHVANNTTWDLVSDIEDLRLQLGIQRWHVFGGSWGSTLALAYASQHAEVIISMILRGIFLCRASELDWFIHGAANFFPEVKATLAKQLPEDKQHDVMNAYAHIIFSDDAKKASSAAHHWNNYESAIMCLIPPAESSPPPSDEIALARAKVQMHYLINQGFLEDRPLLNEVEKFRHIPAIIIQGRYDMVCPPTSAYELHQKWPEANFKIIPDAGHASFETGISAALIEATETMKQHQ